jgi:hypothetical protein
VAAYLLLLPPLSVQVQVQVLRFALRFPKLQAARSLPWTNRA